MFSLNFGMTNSNPSMCLDKVQWKLAKQMENIDFYSIFHHESVTVNLFEILQMESVWHIE